MKNIGTLIKKDFSIIFSDPYSIVFMLLLPLVIAFVAQTVFSPKKNSGFVIPVAFVDKDQSNISGFFSGAIDNDKMKDNFNFIKMTEEEGKKAIEENEIAGIFIIPKGFEDNFFNGKKCNLTLITNPARTISSGVLEDIFSILTDAMDGIRLMFKDELKTIHGMEDFDSIKLLALTKIGYDKVESLKDVVFKNRLEFVKEKKEKDKKSIKQSMAIYFLPGMAFMTILFVIAGFFKRLIEEVEEMTVTRILASPTTSKEILLAKIIYTILICFLVQVVLWTVAIPLFKINIVDYLKFFNGVIYMILTGTVFITLIYSIPIKSKAVEAISSVLIIIVCLLSGIFVTPHTLPQAVAKIINKSPFYFPIKTITNACGIPETGLSLNNQLVFLFSLALVLIFSIILFNRKINKIAKG